MIHHISIDSRFPEFINLFLVLFLFYFGTNTLSGPLLSIVFQICHKALVSSIALIQSNSLLLLIIIAIVSQESIEEAQDI